MIIREAFLMKEVVHCTGVTGYEDGKEGLTFL